MFRTPILIGKGIIGTHAPTTTSTALVKVEDKYSFPKLDKIMSEIPSRKNPVDAAVKVSEVLESSKVPYAISGGIAFAYHCPKRTTIDVDINVGVNLAKTLPRPLDLDHLVDVLTSINTEHQERILCKKKARKSVIEHGRVSCVVDGVKVNLFPSLFEVQSQAVSNASSVQIRDTNRVRLVSAEFVVTCKILLGGDSGMEDVRTLLRYYRSCNLYFDFSAVTKSLKEVNKRLPTHDFCVNFARWRDIWKEFDPRYKDKEGEGMTGC